MTQITALTSNDLFSVRDAEVAETRIITASNLSVSLGSTMGLKKYVAFVSQSGSGAPTATVLENTLSGTVSWNRLSTGAYRMICSDLILSKIAVFVQPQTSANNRFIGTQTPFGNGTLVFVSYDNLSSWNQADGFDAYLMILVYP